MDAVSLTLIIILAVLLFVAVMMLYSLHSKNLGLTAENSALSSELRTNRSFSDQLNASFDKRRKEDDDRLRQSQAEMSERHERELAAANEQRIKELQEANELRIKEVQKANELRIKEVQAVNELRAKEAQQAKEQREDELKAMDERHSKELASMKEAFKLLTAENSEDFQAKSQKSIAEILKPINDKFKEFSDSVKESQEKTLARHSQLEQKIVDLDSRSRQVGDEARNLANALTGYSKIQGDFGEMLLADILTAAGLTEGIHFVTQGVMTDEAGREIKSESGKTMIPDVQVYYPDNTVVIIDSKVSLNAYKEYMNSETVEDRKKFAKAHVESVMAHVNELKDKDYASYVPDGKKKLSDNIMFIPMEGAFRLMMEEEPLLWQRAKDNHVLIVSQMTLFIVLDIVKMGWKQEEQAKNIADVFKTGRELMSQIQGWLESYAKVGRLLESLQGAYDDSVKKVKDSKQSVIKKIDKLEKLGLEPRKSTGKIKTGGRTPDQSTVIPAEFIPEGSLFGDSDEIEE